jgi:hypothetical protein
MSPAPCNDVEHPFPPAASTSRLLRQWVDDGSEFRGQRCTNRISNGVIAQLAEDVAGAEGLLDELELVAIDDVGQEMCSSMCFV